MVVYPVVHVHEVEVLHEVEKARRHDVGGVFLIDHDADDERLLRALVEVTARHPDLLVGVNFLRRPLAPALTLLRQTFGDEIPVSAIWTDFVDLDARPERGSWDGLHFGGLDFKHQPRVPIEALAAVGAAARGHLDVATTSGPATGRAADPARIRALRDGLAGRPVALASGVTPENVDDYRGLVDHLLVASGISAAENGIDETKLELLVTAAR